MKLKIGHGYDAHRLVPNRALILGGVRVPYDKGPDGHSDADVLTHAVIDALFGAAGLGDIGSFFPPDDDSYKDADSLSLLVRARSIIKEKGFAVLSADATIIAQAPKLAPYIQKMRRNIASALEIDAEDFNVKATTEEHMGFTGRGEGIAAHAVCLLAK